MPQILRLWYSVLKHFGEGREGGIKRKYMFANALSVLPGNHEESKKAPKCPDSTEPLSLSKGKLHRARGTTRAHSTPQVFKPRDTTSEENTQILQEGYKNSES